MIAPATTFVHLKLVMPSDPRYLPAVRGAIAPLAAAMGWDEAECRAIALALDEAIANVIRHAYHNRTDGRIELDCCQNVEGLEITMLDQGEAPDKSKICARAIDCEQVGGLGTHIIKDVMDTVSYQATPAGNRFVATKRLKRTT